MKRWVLMAAVALLLVALVPSALAAKGVAYVNRDTLNVYKEADKTSKVVKTLEGGDYSGHSVPVLCCPECNGPVDILEGQSCCVKCMDIETGDE